MIMTEAQFEDHPVPGPDEAEPDTAVPDGVPDVVEDPDPEPTTDGDAESSDEDPDPDQPDAYSDEELEGE